MTRARRRGPLDDRPRRAGARGGGSVGPADSRQTARRRHRHVQRVGVLERGYLGPTTGYSPPSFDSAAYGNASRNAAFLVRTIGGKPLAVVALVQVATTASGLTNQLSGSALWFR